MVDFLRGAGRWVQSHLLSRPESGAPAAPITLRAAEIPWRIESQIADLAIETHPNVATELDRSTRPRHVATRSITQTLRMAWGAALAGMRASALVRGELGSTEVLTPLSTAAHQRCALVVHALPAPTGTGTAEAPATLGALPGAGCLLAMPRDATRAVDLTLVLRRTAEMALAPALIAWDLVREESDSADVHLPESNLVDAYLGLASDRVACPTPAQTLLFGAERRRVPAWLGTQRPVAVGPLRHADALDASLAARTALFEPSLPEIMKTAAADFEALMGRPPPMPTALGLARARTVFVCLGPATIEAEAVARTTRAIGVVGIEWFHPFPSDALREAIGPHIDVLVLERTGHPGPGAPLFDAVRTALGPRAGRVVSVGYGPSTPVPRREDLQELVRQLPGAELPGSVRLGIQNVVGGSAHPDRQAWIEQVARACPADPGNISAPPAANSSAGPAIPHPPSLVADYGIGDRSYDSLPRFWGEMAAPIRTGELSARVADPHRALDVLPPATCALAMPLSKTAALPEIDAGACVACGRCWSACPDGALGGTALPTETLLGTALDRAWPTPESRSAPEVALARRGLRPIAGLVNRRLSELKATYLPRDVLEEAADAYLARSRTEGDAHAALRVALQTLCDHASEFDPAATGPLFHTVTERADVPPSLLLLSVDPGCCQGCGICAERCPTQAIVMHPDEAALRERLARQHAFRTAAPSTPAPVLAHMASLPPDIAVGAALLDRHASEAIVPNGAGEPGSGTKLALRWVAALCHASTRGEHSNVLRQASETLDRLMAALREQLGTSLPASDLGSLERAARSAGQKPGNFAELVASLDAQGQHGSFDAALAAQRAHVARDLEAWIERARTEPAGYGLVLAGPSISKWTTGELGNPFRVPTLCTSSPAAVDVALGLLNGWRTGAAKAHRLQAAARLLADAPRDWPERLEALETATQQDTDDSRVGPLLVVVVDSEVLQGAGLAALNRELAGRTRLCIVLLDDRTPGSDGSDPLWLALGQQSAFTLAGSIAYPGHLATEFAKLLAHRGPSFMKIWCPSPEADRFSPSETLARAELAVRTRLHPLATYDPTKSRVFGECFALGANPDVALPVARDPSGKPATPDALLLGLPRDQAAQVAERRARAWHTLQQLAGVRTPVADDASRVTETELSRRHAEEVRALETRQAREREALTRELRREQVEHLSARLLALAGYGPGEPATEPEDRNR